MSRNSKNTHKIQLNPAIPYGWVSDSALRFGLDNPILVLENITRAEHTVIEKLDKGCTHETLERKWGLNSGLNEFLAKLSPVIIRHIPHLTPLNPDDVAEMKISLVAQGQWPDTDSTKRQILLTGFQQAGISICPAAEIFVVLAKNLIDRSLVSHIQRENKTVLPVVFTDSCVRIGPHLGDDSFPCVSCMIKSQAGRDTDYPIIACQIMNKPAHSVSAGTFRQIAPFIARFLRGIATDKIWSKRQQWILPINKHHDSGLPTVLDMLPSPDCDCALAVADLETIPLAA